MRWKLARGFHGVTAVALALSMVERAFDGALVHAAWNAAVSVANAHLWWTEDKVVRGVDRPRSPR